MLAGVRHLQPGFEHMTLAAPRAEPLPTCLDYPAELVVAILYGRHSGVSVAMYGYLSIHNTASPAARELSSCKLPTRGCTRCIGEPGLKRACGSRSHGWSHLGRDIG